MASHPVTMLRLLAMQCLSACIVAAIAGMVSGWHAAVSAVLGGAACVVPNALFAARLAMAARRASLDANPAVGASRQVGAFFVGEFFKVGATVGLLALIAWAAPNVVWLAVIASVIAVLKTPLLLAFVAGPQ